MFFLSPFLPLSLSSCVSTAVVTSCQPAVLVWKLYKRPCCFLLQPLLPVHPCPMPAQPLLRLCGKTALERGELSTFSLCLCGGGDQPWLSRQWLRPCRGQTSTLAAVAAGCTTVPVLVTSVLLLSLTPEQGHTGLLLAYSRLCLSRL